jgi:hypothetical protein
LPRIKQVALRFHPQHPKSVRQILAIVARAEQTGMSKQFDTLSETQQLLTLKGTVEDMHYALGTHTIVPNNPNERTMRNRRRSQRMSNIPATRKAHTPYRPSPLRPKEPKNIHTL